MRNPDIIRKTVSLAKFVGLRMQANIKE